MALTTRYRLQNLTARSNTLADKMQDETSAYTDSTTGTEWVSHEIKMAGGASSSTAINFGGVTVARTLLVRSPVNLRLKFNGGANQIPLRTLSDSQAILYMTCSATSLTVVKTPAASAQISIRILGT